MKTWIRELKNTGKLDPTILKNIDLQYPPTERAQQLILDWLKQDQCIQHKRPTWVDTHMAVAYEYAKRSHDVQTQHGCVIVNDENRILGIGYNGFMSGVVDEFLPNIRPNKYDWMLHSEINAIFNCEHQPRGATAIVTGYPCLHCYMCMCQVGIKEIVYDSRVQRNAVMLDEDMMTKLDVAKFLTQNITKLTPYEYHGDNN